MQSELRPCAKLATLCHHGISIGNSISSSLPRRLGSIQNKESWRWRLRSIRHQPKAETLSGVRFSQCGVLKGFCINVSPPRSIVVLPPHRLAPLVSRCFDASFPRCFAALPSCRLLPCSLFSWLAYRVVLVFRAKLFKLSSKRGFEQTQKMNSYPSEAGRYHMKNRRDLFQAYPLPYFSE